MVGHLIYLAVEHVDCSVPEKLKMTESLDALTADTLRVIFSAKNAMEASEFLSMCIFSTTIPKYNVADGAPYPKQLTS